jgi:hypothetical protein
MFDPASLRSLINEHGIVVTLRKRVNGAYDVKAGTVTQTGTDYSVKAYFFNNDPSMLPFNQANARYDNIIASERRVVLSDKLVNGLATPEVDVTDQIVYGGVSANVTRNTIISSGTATMCQMLSVSE